MTTNSLVIVPYLSSAIHGLQQEICQVCEPINATTRIRVGPTCHFKLILHVACLGTSNFVGISIQSYEKCMA